MKLRALSLATASAAALLMGASPPSVGPVPPADNQALAHDIFRDIVNVRSVHDIGTKGVADILVKYLRLAASATMRSMSCRKRNIRTR
jgi:hypothetical protein